MVLNQVGLDDFYSRFQFTDNNSVVLAAVATEERLLRRDSLPNSPWAPRRAEGGCISGSIPLPSRGFLHHRAGYLRGRWNDCEWFLSHHLKEDLSQLSGIISFSLDCYIFLDEFLKFIISVFQLMFRLCSYKCLWMLLNEMIRKYASFKDICYHGTGFAQAWVRGWLHYGLSSSIQGLKPPEHFHFLAWSHFPFTCHCLRKRLLLSSFHSSSFSLILIFYYYFEIFFPSFIIVLYYNFQFENVNSKKWYLFFWR